jgi:putative acetyltransferase
MVSKYPQVKDRELVGTYDALAGAGGGYVWDDVLEYRVWYHPEEGDDYYYVFDTYEEALAFSETDRRCEVPLALIVQEEYIDEPEEGQYIHVKQQRIAEWDVEFLSRPRRNECTIPDFFAADAPANRLDILRGLA